MVKNRDFILKYDSVYVVILILMIILLVVNITSLAQDKKKDSADIKGILDRGKLIVGMYYEDMPPFFMTDAEGNLQGLDVELAKDIGDYLQVEVEFNREAGSYQELFEMVVEGEVDVVISKFSKTFKRAREILYTEPYVTFRRALMVSSTYITKNGIKDYPMTHLREARVKVGVKARTSYVEFARELFPNAEIVQLEEWSEAIAALRKGDLEVTFYDENEIIKSVHQNSEIAVFASVYTLVDQKDYIAMAVPQKSTQLLAWLNFFLENFDIDYTVNDLREMYPELYN